MSKQEIITCRVRVATNANLSKNWEMNSTKNLVLKMIGFVTTSIHVPQKIFGIFGFSVKKKKSRQNKSKQSLTYFFPVKIFRIFYFSVKKSRQNESSSAKYS